MQRTLDKWMHSFPNKNRKGFQCSLNMLSKSCSFTQKLFFFFLFLKHFNPIIVLAINYESKVQFINSLPNNKILAWSILRTSADYKINVTEKLKFFVRRVENVIGKGENTCY